MYGGKYWHSFDLTYNHIDRRDIDRRDIRTKENAPITTTPSTKHPRPDLRPSHQGLSSRRVKATLDALRLGAPLIFPPRDQESTCVASPQNHDQARLADSTGDGSPTPPETSDSNHHPMQDVARPRCRSGDQRQGLTQGSRGATSRTARRTASQSLPSSRQARSR